MSRRSAAVKSEGKDRTTHTDLARIRAALFFFLDDHPWRTEGGTTEEEQGGDKAIATVVIVSGVGREYSDCTVHVSHHRMLVKESVDEANPSHVGT
jgi:hypothetical protein